MEDDISLEEFSSKLPKDKLVDYNDFEIIKRIGRGGFGEVFLAEHKASGLLCALKTLYTQNMTSQERKYFIREVDILSRINNPFLLRFLGFSSSIPYSIATEFISKGSLYDAIHHNANSPNLTPTNKTLIALGIAIGMKSLHGMKIIHRDLKTLNILLDDQLLPRICDFGISRVKEEIQQLATQQIGTANWMAPELFESQTYNLKVDVYAYAILLWEMLAEAVPFSGLNQIQIGMAVCTRKERPIIPENTPPLLKKLITSCWHQEPDNRPTFAQIVKAFKSHKVAWEGTDPIEVDNLFKELDENKGNLRSTANIIEKFSQSKEKSISKSNEVPFSNILENINDSNYEVIIQQIINSISQNNFMDFLNIIMIHLYEIKNIPNVIKTLETLTNIFLNSSKCSQLFIESRQFLNLPLKQIKLQNSILKLYESLFIHEPNIISQELVITITQFPIEFSSTILNSLSSYCFNFDLCDFKWEASDFLILKSNDFINSPNSDLLIETLYYLLQKFPSFQPRYEYCKNSFLLGLESTNLSTIINSYLAIINLNLIDINIKSELLLNHLRFPNLISYVITYLFLNPPNFIPSKELISQIIRISKNNQLGIFLLCRFCERNDSAPILINLAEEWLIQAQLNIDDSLKILLSLLCQIPMRPLISNIKILPRFLQLVSVSQSSFNLSLIGTIIRRLEISPAFVAECSSSYFIRSYLNTVISISSIELFTQAASVIDVLLRKAFVNDFLIFLPYIKQLVPYKGPVQQVCITILFMLSKYPQSYSELKNKNFLEVLKPEIIDQSLIQYVHSILTVLN